LGAKNFLKKHSKRIREFVALRVFIIAFNKFLGFIKTAITMYMQILQEFWEPLISSNKTSIRQNIFMVLEDKRMYQKVLI